MIYKQFKDLKLSALGMGAMRLPMIAGDGWSRPVDETAARELIRYAYENGVNYFDTAFSYHGGDSERFLGKVLNEFPRDSWYLASKLPGHMMDYKDGMLVFKGYMHGSNYSSIGDIFQTQLEKCRVDYFDFYLLHNLCETAYDFYTNEDLRVVEYLLEQKKAGKIRHLGFSAHGRAETIESFINAYPGVFEFAQIQLNYLDWYLQEAGKKYDVLKKHSIPVIVMEPVRGGRLCSLSPETDAVLSAARPGETIVSWAFRFLQSLDNVLVVLSGMSTLEQVKENIDTFSTNNPTSEAEIELLQKAIAQVLEMVPCTACRYCIDGCPQKLDIPKLISMYNEMRYENPFTLQFNMGAMGAHELPGACISCGACSELCPQSINIPEIMGKFNELLNANKR